MFTRVFAGLLLGGGVLLPALVMAKATASNTNTLDDTQFVIEKEHESELNETPRLFSKPPAFPKASRPHGLLYGLNALPPHFDLLDHKIRVLKAQEDMLAKFHKNYVSVASNFQDPVPRLSYLLSEKRNTRYSYGFNFDLERTQKMYLGLEGTRFLSSALVKARVDYRGYSQDLSLMSSKVGWNEPNITDRAVRQVMFEGIWEKYAQGNLRYQVRTTVSHLRTNERATAFLGQAKEISANLNLLGGYSIRPSLDVKVDTDIEGVWHEATSMKREVKHGSQYIWRVSPVLASKLADNFDVQGGVSLSAYNTQPNHLDFQLYPYLEVKFNKSDMVAYYIKLYGRVHRPNWRKLLLENALTDIDPSTPLLPHREPIVLQGGTHMVLFKKLLLHGGAKFSKHKDAHFFTTDGESAYKLCYQNVLRFNLFSELEYANPGHTMRHIARANLYFYKMFNKKDKPYNMPAYTLDLLSSFNLSDKILLDTTVQWWGGMVEQVQELEAILDISLGMTYSFTSRLSFSCNLGNILNRPNQRYLCHQEQPFEMFLGVNYAW